MSDDVRLDLLKDAISESGLDGQTKDALADDLRYAQTINGTDNEALQGIKRLVIGGIRRELLAHDRTMKAIDAHEHSCAERSAALSADFNPNRPASSAQVFVATVSAVATALRPIAWPLAIVCFSPNAVELVRIAIAAFAKQ